MKDIIRNDFVHAELSYKIIGCAMSVYNSIGPGLLEKVYQNALATSFRNADLSFSEQASCDIFYAGQKVGIRRADFLVENKVIVEIKRGNDFIHADFNQLKEYLAAKNLELGLLIRFSGERLHY
ncbi:MAG TPA: GxxExxY protein [Bacteroidia bacterium]|jgi:GxxExxY protein|nr:GxxExxY protein [Bacteroidia bacterium]